MGDTTQPQDAAKLLSKEVLPKAKNMDDLYCELGEPGRLQVLLFLFLALNLLTGSSNAVVGMFFGYSPVHQCNRAVEELRPGNLTETEYTRTYSIHQDSPIINVTVPSQPASSSAKVEVLSRQSCSVTFTVKGYENITESCQSGPWKYFMEPGEATTVTDFDLVCDATFLANLANTLFYLGVMIGGFACGYLSDTYGRKPVITVTLILTVAVGAGVAFTPNLILFIILRIVMGALIQGLITTSYILALELFAARYRSVAGTTFQVFWGVGVIYLGGVAWLAQGWRFIQLAILAPTVLCAITVWFQQESVRWLITRGKIRQATLVVNKFTSFNGLPRPHVKDYTSQANPTGQKVKRNVSYLTLLKTPVLRKRTLCVSFIAFAANVGYFGMTYYTPVLAGNRYLNFLLGAITETLAYIVETLIVIRFGRKKPLIGNFLTGSLCCLVVVIIPWAGGGEIGETGDIVVTIFSIAGKCSMAGLFIVTDMFTAELFPTEVRNMSVGVCIFMSRMGAVLVPQIFFLSTVTFTQLPPLVIAACGITAVFLTFSLPETKGKLLPDTIQEIETPRCKDQKFQAQETKQETDQL